ncbi:MAG: hypothetical protein NWF01_06515 [Candidatus Bathyarchaeota archaeon]|nr:hypothetical protein [Candidatus Bathyarchaeota archaeon]
MLEFFVLIVLFVVLVLAIMYLPALWELRKPKDNEPRLIEPPTKTNQNSIASEMET